MRHHCSICYEYLFDSLEETTVLKCGHTMHSDCLSEMLNHDKYRYCCPICSKSVIDMSKIWRKMDEEVRENIIHCSYTETVGYICIQFFFPC
ncbi:hypothetical protein BHM03_00032780 [Ensete ventricosum]|nr:hypothetical protein BHM03_00032780 [Ensete ventricosum]